MNPDLTTLTLSAAAERIARHELSPVDLTRACLERIAKLDSQINCFITPDPEGALQQAAEAEAALKASPPRSPLYGIPLALKDLYDLRGLPTTAGAQVFSGYVAQEDAAAVEKLRTAGAIFLGKVNMHEIALGVTNVNPHYGPCRNPWDRTRISGGSSGGSAAGVSAGLFLGSLGSDTGGSIRIPASLCGVVGLKPTYGRVSLRGVLPLSWNLDHAGPLARSVRDAALLLQEIAGYDPQDPASADVTVPDYVAAIADGVRDWRVALAAGEFFERSDPEVLAAVHQAAQLFQDLGARVEEVDLSYLREAALANGLIVPSDGAAYHRERMKARPEDFGPDVLQRLRNGESTSLGDYILARRTQASMRRRLERFFEGYDLLLAPATPVAAPPIEGPDAIEQARLLTRFTAPFNLTGLPALSLPCGFTRDRLPVGLQIVGGPWGEAAVLRAAYAYEQAAAWDMRPPLVK